MEKGLKYTDIHNCFFAQKLKTIADMNKTEHFIFVVNKNTEITLICTMINSNGRLRRGQWSSSQAATLANILIKFEILQQNIYFTAKYLVMKRNDS